MPGVVDLHLHSTASDGVCSPADLVRLCLRQGLRFAGLTDHDTVGGVAEALAGAEGTALTVIPGVEISTDVARTEVHILGYFVDWHSPSFAEVLSRLQRSRLERAQKMVRRLEELGRPVEWGRVQALAAGGSVGRPHVAQAMVERRYVGSIPEAFQRYLSRNGPAYVERYKLAPVEAVHLVVEAGGLPVLAHPVILEAGGQGLGQFDELEERLPSLVEAGLVGMEVRYPMYPAFFTEQLSEIAARFGLLTTGGTDFHGRGALTTPPGDVWVPVAVVEALQARHRGAAARPPASRR